MKTILPKLSLFFLPLLISVAVAKEDSAFQAPALTGTIIDEVGVMNSQQLSGLNDDLRELSNSGVAQIAVLITRSLQGLDIADYGIRLAEAWKIGTKSKERLDRGVIFIIAPNDRRMRIEVGYGLEGRIPDATASQILEEIVKPEFRANRMSDGIYAGTRMLIKLARAEGADSPMPSHVRSDRKGRMSSNSLMGGLVLLLVLLLMGVFSQIPFALGGGILIGVQFFSSIFVGIGIAALLKLISWVIFRGGGPGGRGGGFFDGFGGGGFGGGLGGGSFGGGGGGFSGGGGSFGGGGSSSSW